MIMELLFCKRFSVLLTLSFFSLFLFSCTLMKPLPPVSVYTISPHSFEGCGQKARQGCMDSVLKLAPMMSSQSLDSTAILYRDRHYGLNSYAFSRWSDSPSSMLEILFANALDQASVFMAVVPPVSGAGYDLLLESRLIDCTLHLDTEKGPEGVVSVEFFLIEADTGRLLAKTSLTASEPAASPVAADAVSALNRAAGRVAEALSQWLSQWCGREDD